MLPDDGLDEDPSPISRMLLTGDCGFEDPLSLFSIMANTSKRSSSAAASWLIGGGRDMVILYPM